MIVTSWTSSKGGTKVKSSPIYWIFDNMTVRYIGINITKSNNDNSNNNDV